MSAPVVITGVVRTWKFRDTCRRFADINLPYAVAARIAKPVPYNAMTGDGVQRAIDPKHLLELRKAIENGTYTPVGGAIGLSKKHAAGLVVQEKEGVSTFALSVSPSSPLSLTDAGHRMEAIAALIREAKERLGKSEDADERRAAEADIEQLEALPFSFTVHLDGNPQLDFINLQKGKSVDKSHMFSLQTQQKLSGKPDSRAAVEIAKVLYKLDGSPFKNLIKFDSRSRMPLPLTTLCATGSSDIGTSLVGLARLAAAAPQPMSPLQVGHAVVRLFAAIGRDAPRLLEEGKVLTPLENSGKNGSATMLIGLAACLVHEMAVAGEPVPSDATLARVVSSASATLDIAVHGSFSSADKRRLLGTFAREFFAGGDGLHDGVPLPLLTTLSASAFGATRLPRVKK